MKNHRIAFIGAGNMAGSLIGGLVADGFDPGRICAADPDEARLAWLREHIGIETSRDNDQAVADADVVVLSVKPQQMKSVASTLSLPSPRPLVISVAAGIREEALARWLGEDCPVVRAMPNTPALVQCGATALHANARVTPAQRDLAEFVMRAVGLVVWLKDEALMDAVTALSGSGPAYVFLVMEAMTRAGRRLGLPEDIARLLTLQTTFGAAKMALETSEDSATLRKRVTSPGGTTERALAVLQGGGLEALFERALKAAHERAGELAQRLGE
ncbi:MAG TPA: pyrroline-5-carboxylate reductase [Gammaproteobacteria bacterium]|nr:pyrroline-5-carboxylate reductase [Gammaproteobacteria bacterium]